MRMELPAETIGRWLGPGFHRNQGILSGQEIEIFVFHILVYHPALERSYPAHHA